LQSLDNPASTKKKSIDRKILVAGGDFQQCLPVQPRSNGSKTIKGLGDIFRKIKDKNCVFN